MSKKEQEKKVLKDDGDHINRAKVELLKSKFNFIRKIKPLKVTKAGKNKPDKFDPRTIDKDKEVNMSAIWEKARKDRTPEERYHYRKEARTYHKYFLLYMSREIRRTRWTPRKELNMKFITTVLFIAFFAALFAALGVLLIYLFQITDINK